MATWKLAPALAAGNCIVLKPAEQTPASILVLVELIQDLLPAGVLNVVNGYGVEVGRPLATNPRIAKIAFTGARLLPSLPLILSSGIMLGEQWLNVSINFVFSDWKPIGTPFHRGKHQLTLFIYKVQTH